MKRVIEVRAAKAGAQELGTAGEEQPPFRAGTGNAVADWDGVKKLLTKGSLLGVKRLKTKVLLVEGT